MLKQVLVSFCSFACLFLETTEKRLLKLLGWRVGAVKERESLS